MITKEQRREQNRRAYLRRLDRMGAQSHKITAESVLLKIKNIAKANYGITAEEVTQILVDIITVIK